MAIFCHKIFVVSSLCKEPLSPLRFFRGEGGLYTGCVVSNRVEFWYDLSANYCDPFAEKMGENSHEYASFGFRATPSVACFWEGSSIVVPVCTFCLAFSSPCPPSREPAHRLGLLAFTRLILCLVGGQFSAVVAGSILQNCKRISGKLGVEKGLLFLFLFARDGSMPQNYKKS